MKHTKSELLANRLCSIPIPGLRRLAISPEIPSLTGSTPFQLFLKGFFFGFQLSVLKFNSIKVVPSYNKRFHEFGLCDILEQSAVYATCMELELQPHELLNELDKHSEFLAKWRLEIDIQLSHYTRFWNRIKPKSALVFQGFLPSSAIIRHLAQSSNTPCYAIERSAFSQRWVVTKSASTTIGQQEAAEAYRRFKGTLTPQQLSSYSNAYWKSIDQNKSKEHTSPKQKLHLNQRNEKRLTLLFLGQVYTDASIIFGSKSGLDVLSVMRQLIDTCRRIKARLIIKTHPKEAGFNNPIQIPYNFLTWRKLQKAIPGLDSLPNVLIDNDNSYSTFSLINLADIIVTLNSQAGLEAAIAQKPVITCGEAFYNGMGFTHEPSSTLELDSVIRSLAFNSTAQKRTNEIEARGFFYFYNEIFCIDPSFASLIRKIQN